MSFDAWTAAAVADELRETILGGRVQQVVQVDEESLALEVYARGRRRYLLASANRQWPRLHLLSDRPRRGVDTPSPLLQMARKWLRGATLGEVVRPPWERVIALQFVHPEHGATRLVAELIGRRANLLLLRPAEASTDPGAGAWPGGPWRVMTGVHLSGPDAASPEGSGRVLLPGRLYDPLPPPPGIAPDRLTLEDLRRLLAEATPDEPAWRRLVQGLQGFSPLVAREVLWRATGDAQAPVDRVAAPEPVLWAVRELVTTLETGAWQPCLALEPDGRPAAFAPYPLWHRAGPGLSGLQAVESISAAAQRYYDAALAAEGDAYAVARRQVAAALQRARDRLRRRREAIRRELLPEAEIEALRSAGQWILALAAQVQPGQQVLRLPEEAGGAEVALDPALSPAENAAAYFKRYRKAQRAAALAGPRLEQLEADLAYLDQLAADLAMAGNRSEIDAVRAALAAAGLDEKSARSSRRAKPTPPAEGPRRFTTAEGYEVLVGRNSRQNDHITFEVAQPDDLWLHARGWPGAHVVIRSGGRPVSEASLHQAAALAAYYSAGRSEAWVDVMVARRRFVRRAPGGAPGGRPGMVTVREEQVVRVRPTAPPDDSRGEG
ncbi:MAG: NFACT family protein [Caldilineales bacterium]|nr:NFACT family protein [Caldilineales bacterium]MDW8317717.1 NFACT RNA binding domain-containing protein [Anaerolineae bacterium]